MYYLLIAFLTLLNGVFAMSELALVSSRKIRLQALGNDRRTQTALRLLEQPTQFLSTVQVGATSIGLLNGIVGQAAFSTDLSRWLEDLGLAQTPALILATAVVITSITFITIIFGELVPKRIGQMFPETVARWVALPMAGLAAVFKPFILLLTICTKAVLRLLRVGGPGTPIVTEEEIRASLIEGVNAGLIEKHEHQMLRNVFHLDDRPLTSIMTPREDIVWLDAQLSVSDALAIIHAESQYSIHSWYPVCRAHIDRVVGLVSASILSRLGTDCEDDIQAHILPAQFIPETLSGMEMLEQWRERSARLLLVVDEYGIIQGLLTPRDLLEAITGELKADTPVDAWAIQLAPHRWHLDGTIPINELKARLEILALPLENKGRYNTLAGLIMFVLGRLPKAGERVHCEGWDFQITQMKGRHIESVLAEKLKIPVSSPRYAGGTQDD